MWPRVVLVSEDAGPANCDRDASDESRANARVTAGEEDLSDDSSTGDLRDRLEPCRRCGTPIASVTSVGPHEHYAGPCGCRVSPSVLD